MPVQIAFNAIPQIDQFQDNGYQRNENGVGNPEDLGRHSIQVNPTCVRIPVFYGHSEAVHIETAEPIEAAEVERLLSKAPGVKVFKGQKYPTAVTDSAGTDPVFVGRIRKDISHQNGINMWVVSDNVRKGAALNSIQIAEVLVAEHMLDKQAG